MATVEDGRFVALNAHPSHPTGQALCMKGKVAPEIVYHRERLTQPLKRTRPKGDRDPGWQPITWEQALAEIASSLRALADQHGAESVAFASASPSTSAMSDSLHWLERLRRAFGTPNMCGAVELCAWGRYFASSYTFGAPLPGAYMPDLERAECIVFWGYNPSVSRLSHATATAAAVSRGARLIVVDPRRVGLARRADAWLRVRPGTDAALALSIAHVMIERGWYDEPFVRRWTNACLLVRSDNGRLLRAGELGAADGAESLVAWSERRAEPVLYRVSQRRFDCDPQELLLRGEMTVETEKGPVRCRTVFDVMVEACRAWTPAVAAEHTGVAADAVERAAQLLWQSRPVALYFWSGVEQHTSTSQIARAICQLYALTGCIDAPGGNVRFGAVATGPIHGEDLLSPEQRRKVLGADRPLGLAQWQLITSDDLYTAALEGRPYRVRGLVTFGANLLLANADSRRGHDALAGLDFYVHADLFMNPTAELADIVLPVTSPFESEGLRTGFEVSPRAQTLIQLRKPVAARPGQARSDTEIIFDLARHLGLGQHFWDGDVDRAYRHVLEPTGVTLETLRARPEGVEVAVETRYRKYAETGADGPRGFGTGSGLIELYAERLAEHGYSPVPTFAADGPAISPHYPLILTCAKSSWYCESQHRQIASLRKRAPDPELEIHPDTAMARAIAAGDWLRIVTPTGSARARARFNDSLSPDVVCGQHGWWQACDELEAAGGDPCAHDSINLNQAIVHSPADPMSKTVPLRSYVCEVVRDD